MRATPTTTISILVSTLVCLVSGTLLSEIFAQLKDNSKQIVVGAEENEQAMILSPKVNLTDTDTKLVKNYIDEARKALKNADIIKALINLKLAEHMLQLAQSSYQQHSSIQNDSQ